MPTPTQRRRDHERGTTLVEAMVALAILLVGLLAMARFQIYGMTTTQGARAYTVASELAVELANGLSALPYNDARLSGVDSATPGVPPSGFGPLINATLPATGVHDYDDSNLIPQTHRDAELERDATDPTLPVYRRRWSVWNVATTTTNNVTAKLIAVSVIWRERGLPNPREIVVYVHSELRGSFMADLNAFR